METNAGGAWLLRRSTASRPASPVLPPAQTAIPLHWSWQEGDACTESG